MDKIRNALKCVNCKETLSTPILLPCGHMICQSHADETQEQIICEKCGTKHRNREFAVAKAVSEMIEAQLDSLDFGDHYTECVESCDALKNQLEQNEFLLNNNYDHIQESISELSNQVLLKSEQLKLKIDEITQELLDELKFYEKRCQSQCQIDKNFLALKKELKESNDEEKEKLNEWMSDFEVLKVDVEKWDEMRPNSGKYEREN